MYVQVCCCSFPSKEKKTSPHKKQVSSIKSVADTWEGGREGERGREGGGGVCNVQSCGGWLHF